MACAVPLIEVPDRRLELVRDPDRIEAVRRGPRPGRREGERPSLVAIKGGSAPWTPAALGADLWGYGVATALTVVGGKVTSWPDLSGNGNHLTAAGAAQPTYEATGGPASNPVVSFDGAANYMRKAATLASPTHVFLACIFDGTGVPQPTLFDGGGNSVQRVLIAAGPLLRMYANGYSAQITPTLNSWTVVDASFVAGAGGGKIGLNGGAQASTALTDPAPAPGGFTIGAKGTGGEYAKMKAAAWIVAKRPLTAAERALAVLFSRTAGGF